MEYTKPMPADDRSSMLESSPAQVPSYEPGSQRLQSLVIHRSINRSMRDVAWFNFFNILSFKAEEAGKNIVKVPAKNTSQMCSNCQILVPKTLDERIHKCSCETTLDRDHNAALNILRLGTSLQHL